MTKCRAGFATGYTWKMLRVATIQIDEYHKINIVHLKGRDLSCSCVTAHDFHVSVGQVEITIIMIIKYHIINTSKLSRLSSRLGKRDHMKSL